MYAIHFTVQIKNAHVQLSMQYGVQSYRILICTYMYSTLANSYVGKVRTYVYWRANQYKTLRMLLLFRLG